MKRPARRLAALCLAVLLFLPCLPISAHAASTGTTTAYVNLRTGPGTDYAILETVPLGAQISILDTGNPGWYRVTAPSGNSGYMCSDYILASGGDAGASTVLFTARTTAFVNLRAGPGTGYGIYLTVPLGDTVSVLDTANAGWYRVQYGSYTGYMSADYLQTQSAAAPTPAPPDTSASADPIGTARTTAVLNIRTGPSTGYRSLGLLDNGETVTVLENCGNGWYAVRTSSNTFGYCSGDYLRVTLGTSPAPQPEPTPQPSEPDTATRWNGRTTAFVNLRSGPSTGYRIYLTVPLGDAITILDRSNSGWYRVQYGSYTGYMSSDYIEVLGAVEETPDPTVPTPPPAGTVDVSDPLLLVNPWNAVPEDYAVSLVSIGDGESVDQRCYGDLMQMLDDCAVYGNAQPYVCSSYRTNDTQTRLYENKVDRLIAQGYSPSDARTEAAKAVAIPGTSEHQLGLAVDIVDLRYQVLDAGQEDTATQQWLMQNSWKYGFILRYPNDKTAVTGIIYEPWHYRYVGRENAKAIYESGLCLEEYLQAQGK